jgi:hypothetical protein
MQTEARSIYEQRQGNCAWSVAKAFSKHSPQHNVDLDQFADCGHGKAPGSLCGALHAARTLAPASAEAITKAFSDKTQGHLVCREIRASRTLKCAECVELGAGLLDQATQQ